MRSGLVLRCSVLWCGVARCGVVWCGVVACCGVAWCGVPRPLQSQSPYASRSNRQTASFSQLSGPRAALPVTPADYACSGCYALPHQLHAVVVLTRQRAPELLHPPLSPCCTLLTHCQLRLWRLMARNPFNPARAPCDNNEWRWQIVLRSALRPGSSLLALRGGAGNSPFRRYHF